MEKVGFQEKNESDEDLRVKHKSGRCSTHCFWISIVVLGVIVIALLAVVIALGVVLGNERSRGDSGEDICLTDDCIQLSAQIAASLNQSVDPCENFYEFSCGNWIRNNAIEPGQGLKQRVVDGMDQINIFLRKILEGGDDGGVAAVRKAIDLYTSCVNTAQIDALGAQPMINLLNSTGGWSLIGLNEPEPWNINSTTGFIFEKLHGSSAFFDISFSADDLNSSLWVPFITPSTLALPDYSNEILIGAYRNLIVSVLSILHPDGDLSIFGETADAIISLERQLSEIVASSTELRDLSATYNPYSLQRLPELWPDFDWNAWFSAAYDNTEYTMNNEQIFIVQSPSYFRNLSGIIQSTNNTILRDYTRLQFVIAYLPSLSAEFTDALQTFNMVLQGTQGSVPRTDTCIASVQRILPIALARPFVENYMPQGTKETVSMMIQYIKAAFKDRINELGDDWLDDVSRIRSLDKVDALTQMVAYPDDILNNDYVNGISADYSVDPNDYFGNILRVFDVARRRELRRLMEGTPRTTWYEEFAPTDINAFYIPSLNQFVFLSGILRLPIFAANWPEYFNFGSFGFVIGHELTHGFDDQGQQFDKNGIRQQWWTDESMTAFTERQQCFIDQYSRFTNEGAQVNGALTLGENIADNGGINTAFKAYRARVEGDGTTQQRLPGLPYTPDQLFFIATGQIWCALYTPEIASILVETSVHSPGSARVRGPLMNSEDFAKAYNCAVGSPMNPPAEDKCVIW